MINIVIQNSNFKMLLNIIKMQKKKLNYVKLRKLIKKKIVINKKI